MKTFEELQKMIRDGIGGSFSTHVDHAVPAIQIKGTFVAVTTSRLSEVLPSNCPVICRFMDGFSGPNHEEVSVTYYPDNNNANCRLTTICAPKHLDMSKAYASARARVLANITSEDLAAELAERTALSTLVEIIDPDPAEVAAWVSRGHSIDVTFDDSRSILTVFKSEVTQ